MSFAETTSAAAIASRYFIRVGPSSPTAPAGMPSMVTGATISAQVDSGSKPCSEPIATESP